MIPDFDVAIVGAGPYGIGAGARLRELAGLDVRVFGEPMEFWNSHMPEGMLLRSPWDASHIGSSRKLTFDSYREASGQSIPVPIPVEQFVAYGKWLQRQAIPDVDTRRVARLDKVAKGFALTLDDGARCTSGRVVIAAGIGPFARRLPQFEGFSPEFVSHASDQRNVSRFAGKRVVVVGAGQSALEGAALIHEAGAEVELIVRASQVHWLGMKDKIHKIKPIAKLLYSPYDIGPAGVSRIVAVPNMVKYFPRPTQNWFRKRALRSAGARWLKPRFTNIPITINTSIESAKLRAGKLHLRLNDGSSREVDHVYQGTGYRVDVSQYSFLPPEVLKKVALVNGFPRVSAGFESSVPGLHFLGAPSAWDFGPLMFFVCGTDFAASSLGRHIAPELRSKVAA
jgi:cation diffusion facilitator CzcD-associated flavoprotein CzcO